MAIPSFYTPDLVSDMAELMLPDEEAAHAVKSRRLGQGQAIRLFNGRGLTCIAEINTIDRRSVGVTIGQCTQHEPIEQRLVIAAAVPKGDRQKVMVDMLTQLGVSQIQPLSCEHSVTRFNDKMRSKWQRWAIEACKQSQNPWLPIIGEQFEVTQLLSHHDELIYADMNGQNLANALQGYTGQSGGVQTHDDLIALIGPEGGFSKREVQMFADNKLKPVRLGGHILRTEAAAISLASQWAQHIT